MIENQVKRGYSLEKKIWQTLLETNHKFWMAQPQESWDSFFSRWPPDLVFKVKNWLLWRSRPFQRSLPRYLPVFAPVFCGLPLHGEATNTRCTFIHSGLFRRRVVVSRSCVFFCRSLFWLFCQLFSFFVEYGFVRVSIRVHMNFRVSQGSLRLCHMVSLIV